MTDTLNEFMDCLFHCDTVCVSLDGIGATNFETRDIHLAIQAIIDGNESLKSELGKIKEEIDNLMVERGIYVNE